MVCHISKSRDRESHETLLAAIGNLGEREIIETYILSSEAGGVTIYDARQEYISRAEKESEVTIWNPREIK